MEKRRVRDRCTARCALVVREVYFVDPATVCGFIVTLTSVTLLPFQCVPVAMRIIRPPQKKKFLQAGEMPRLWVLRCT